MVWRGCHGKAFWQSGLGFEFLPSGDKGRFIKDYSPRLKYRHESPSAECAALTRIDSSRLTNVPINLIKDIKVIKRLPKLFQFLLASVLVTMVFLTIMRIVFWFVFNDPADDYSLLSNPKVILHRL